MKTFYQALGELLHRRPPEFLERLSPWIIAIVGTGILAIMFSAWWTAR